MTYPNGEQVRMGNEVITAMGTRGNVVGYDKINERDYVAILIAGGSTIWASTNSVEKHRTLKVITK